jgi:tape measure domain-containing protein
MGQFPMSGMMTPAHRVSTGGGIGIGGGSFIPTGGGGGGNPPGGGGGGNPASGGGGSGRFGGIVNFARTMGSVSLPGLPGAGVINELGSEFAFATKQVLLFSQAYKLLAFIQDFPAQVATAVGQLQSFRNTLDAITPSAQEFSTSNKYILSLVDQYNIPLQSARDGFTKLYASMQPAGFSGQEIRGIFEGISMGAATFGMSADKVDRVMYAFAQMASKGQVMSEELKGQLGDVLPGSLALFARAADMSLQDFGAAMEAGAFKGDAMKQLLINVGATMKEEFGKGAVGAALTFQGVMNRLTTSTQLFYETFEPAAIAFANAFIVPITNGIRIVTDGFKELMTGQSAVTQGGSELAAQIRPLIPIFEGIANNAKMVAGAALNIIKALAPVVQLFLQLAASPVVGFLAQMYVSVILLNGAFSLLGGKILVGLIGSLVQTAAKMMALNAAAIATNVSLAGSRLQLMMLASGAVQTGAAMTTLGTVVRTAVMTTMVGAVVTGVGLMMAEFFRLRGVMDSIEGRYKSLGDQARMMGESGNLAGIQRLKQATTEQANTYEQIMKGIQAAEERRPMLSKGIAVDAETAALIKRAGQGAILQGEGGILDKDLAALKQAINLNRQQTKKNNVIYQDQESKARRIASELDAKLNKASLPPGEGDDKDAKKAAKEAETQANQQQQLAIDAANRENALNKAIAEGRMALDSQSFEHQLRLIDARNNYELAGLNSIEAQQEKFQQDLKKLELDRIATVRKAEEQAAKAALDYSAAQNTAAAAGEATTAGGVATSGGLPSGIKQYITGDPSSKYYMADHGGSNYHEHLEFATRALAEAAYQTLTKAGVQVTEFKGYGRVGGHTQGSAHYAGRAFDVPGAQVPVGKEKELTARVQSLLGFGGAGGSYTRQRRTEKAGGNLQVEQQQMSNQLEEASRAAVMATNEALAQREALIKSNMSTIFPVAEQQLENDLMKVRNQLQLQGMPKEYIDYQEKVAEVSYKMSERIKRNKEDTDGYEKAVKALQDKQQKGIKLTLQEEQALTFNAEAIKQSKEELKNLTEQQKLYQIAQLESAIATMKNADALKAMEETSGRINDAVGGISDTYKSLFKELAMGADSVDALKKAQQALADQALTMVFDFAMKPMEDFMKDTLGAIFGIPSEQQQRDKAIASAEAQLKELKAHKVTLDKIEVNTATSAGLPPAASGAPSVPAPGQASSYMATSFNDAAADNVMSTLALGSLSESASAYSAEIGKVDTSIWNSAMSVGEAAKEIGPEGPAGAQWQKALGQVVGGIGMAAGSIMGIAAGINQIKEGGTSNVLGGIGMIASMAGSLLGSFSSLGGLFSGGGGGGVGAGLAKAPLQPKISAVFANGGVARGGFRAFANGGVVGGPTLGLMGEGKYNEAIVPLPDGKSIPVQLGGRSARDLMGGGAPGMPQASTLNMKFETTKINGVEYVSREQLEVAMAETRRASIAGGARQGMSMTLDKIKQSPSTRSSIGI